MLLSKISPTAKLIAYLRSFSDIPFSKEISGVCEAEKVFKEITGDLGDQILHVAPRVEARYKSVDVLLRRSGCRRILELASGLSPRGFVWSEDRSITYIISDLLGMLEEHENMSETIAQYIFHRSNLFWVPIDAINKWQVTSVERITSRGPIAVVHEGLLPYFSHEEKRLVAENIRILLQKHGGVWIMPDITSREQLQVLSDPAMLKVREIISGLTERDITQNAFATFREGENFFEDLGFTVTSYNQGDIVDQPLSSVAATNSDPVQIAKSLEVSKIWELRLK
jgi:O-methyltransferase involved in polyketide biosynthesis